MMQAYLDAVHHADLTCRSGHVLSISGQSIEAQGPDVSIGEVCEVSLAQTSGKLLAEVVGMRPGRVILMPYGDLRGIAAGSRVEAVRQAPGIPVGASLLGRVIDAFGVPIDGGTPLAAHKTRSLHAAPINPLSRPRIKDLMPTGVRAIDTMLPLGRGQRMGIFAGSGVGKSTLLGMLARDVQADVNVIALIGERGREVREFVEKQLGLKGLERSVVVVATSDQPALVRTRAAYAATAIAEHFREEGQQVLLMMDSITRFAMARREIGLAAGEPPTARGYTPSVFSDIPALCERCGTTDSGGAITALYTVLVEGDDFNEPISDIVRATLDGHIMLSRELAHEGHFPSIDVLQSTSRLASELVGREDQDLMLTVVEALSTYQRNRQMVDMGAYRSGSNAAIDRAIALHPAIIGVLRQSVQESTTRADALARLRAALVVRDGA
ncbi:FliI/YscN family ATPase [Janthinobacterium sp. GW460P]|uniref:FliI/YscN family ATPase n=1 Tax=unclassified Janthinobacterium TaxID=2610881 RepID=UPI000A3298E0|nr:MULTISPECIES: FliI/YscN family ATPase [unclassified Janthinobacterium]MCC7705596.1 FliI/YscN family ATPase [Janthinobacterium sp. GW460P]MCC7711098.1 FliI/YscN family ATPase [Janthinobacterium sp. GW460W]